MDEIEAAAQLRLRLANLDADNAKERWALKEQICELKEKVDKLLYGFKLMKCNCGNSEHEINCPFVVALKYLKEFS